jgi:aspartate aminotransferase
MNVPGLEEHAIMIDSVSKDTACAVQELDVLSLKKQSDGSSMKFAQARLSPPTIEQIASEAALDTTKLF